MSTDFLTLQPEKRPVIFVGDLHGSVDFFRKLRREFGGTHDFCLVGDLLDSFTEGIPNQVALVSDVLTMMKDGKGVCLKGNHDLNYIHRGDARVSCTGYKTATQVALLDFLPDMQELLLSFYYWGKEKLLVSHAGLSRQLYDQYLMRHMEPSGREFAEMLYEWSENLDSPFYQVGYSRGGSKPVGGLTWCDWSDEFIPVPGLMQVMGHSHSRRRPHQKRFHEAYLPLIEGGDVSNIRMSLNVGNDTANNYNVDCLYPEGHNNWDVLCWVGGTVFYPLRVEM